jgi:hypothetical protein
VNLKRFKTTFSHAIYLLLGTDKKSSEIAKAFYYCLCFNVSTGEEYTTVSIEGLQENFGKAVTMEVINNVQPDEAALKAL